MAKYWLDFAGRLWKGPVAKDSNLRYARFHGYMRCHPFDEIWILERSDWPIHSWEITEQMVKDLMAKWNRTIPAESVNAVAATVMENTATNANLS